MNRDLMKIRTEIFQGTFIITCIGSTMDSSLVKEFLSAMGGFLGKTELDILLDMEGVGQVDSTGLNSIARALKELNPMGSLVLCGVEPRIQDLLKMADLGNIFIQKSNRQTALGHLLLQRKVSETQVHTSSFVSEAPVQQQMDEIVAEDPTEEEETALLWDVAMEDFEEIEDEEYSARAAATPRTKPTPEKEKTVAPDTERRRYRRISHQQIMNEELIIYCKNMVTGKNHPAIIENISPGGLLMNSRSKLSIGDELLLEGRIGRNFKFKEHAISRSCHSEGYGLEFVNLSNETSHFLSTLTGSVDMIQANRFVSDRPN